VLDMLTWPHTTYVGGWYWDSDHESLCSRPIAHCQQIRQRLM